MPAQTLAVRRPLLPPEEEIWELTRRTGREHKVIMIVDHDGHVIDSSPPIAGMAREIPASYSRFALLDLIKGLEQRPNLLSWRTISNRTVRTLNPLRVAAIIDTHTHPPGLLNARHAPFHSDPDLAYFTGQVFQLDGSQIPFESHILYSLPGTFGKIQKKGISARPLSN